MDYSQPPNPNAGQSRQVRWDRSPLPSPTGSSSSSSSMQASSPRNGFETPIRPLMYPATPAPQTVQLPPIASFYALSPLYPAMPAVPRYPHPRHNELQLNFPHAHPSSQAQYQPYPQYPQYRPHHSVQRPITPPRSTNASPISYREFRPHFWAPEDDSYNPPRYPSAVATGPGTAVFDPSWTPPAWPPLSPLAPVSSSPRAQSQTSSNLPSQAQKFLLAPYLAPNLRHPDDPHLIWNVTERPEKCKRVTSRGCLVPFMGTGASSAQATAPKCERIEVWIPYMRPCWGPVVVSPSNARSSSNSGSNPNEDQDRNQGETGGGFVTISDVLLAIHTYLQTPVSSEDVSALTKLPQGQAIYLEICSTFEKRCADAPGLPAFERKQGVRRVDFLRDEVGFWGMWQRRRRDGSWCLVARFCALNIEDQARQR